MKELIRNKYLDKLITYQDSRFIKIISGIRGVGKSHYEKAEQSDYSAGR